MIAIETDKIIENILNITIQPAKIITTGHLSTAVTAKYVSLKYGIPSAVFESPKIELAGISSMLVNARLRPNDFSNLTKTNSNKIHNYFSDSIFSFMEDETFVNLQMPKVKSFFSPPNPFETFCLFEAGCVSTDIWDRFCSLTIGREKYMTYFEKWNRTRKPITETFIS